MDIATKCFYQNKRLIWQFPVKESTECRKVDGFTRKKLAAKIGTSGPIVGRYESELFNVLDAYLRDYKTSTTYSKQGLLD